MEKLRCEVQKIILRIIPTVLIFINFLYKCSFTQINVNATLTVIHNIVNFVENLLIGPQHALLFFANHPINDTFCLYYCYYFYNTTPSSSKNLMHKIKIYATAMILLASCTAHCKQTNEFLRNVGIGSISDTYYLYRLPKIILIVPCSTIGSRAINRA